MNKTLIIAIVAVVLLLLGVGGFLLMSQSKPATRNTVSVSPSSSESPNTTQKTSLKSLMSLGANQTCTFTDAATGSSGTMYIGRGTARGDFQSTVSGRTTMSHMINDGTVVYVWMDGQAQGFKSSLDAIEKLSGSAQNTVNVNAEVDYSCTPATPDAAKFTVPTDVTFSDFSNLM